MGYCFSYTQIKKYPIYSFEDKIIYQDMCSGSWLLCKCYGIRYLEKRVGIWGFTGSGKTSALLYIGLYDVSMGIFVMITAIMEKVQ